MKTALAAYIGIITDDDPTVQAQTAAEWNSFTSAMGETPSMMLTYLDPAHTLSEWTTDAQWLVASWADSPWLAGFTPIVGLPMTFTGNNADTDFKAIASGQWDQTLNGVFQTFASAGYKNFDIRPGYEMNGTWMAWSINSQNVGDYLAAFQHIANLAHNFSGASIQVVWSPNLGNVNADALPVSSYYPGNAYVDVIGPDAYGPPVGADTDPTSVSTGPSDLTLQTALAMAKVDNKPFAMGETGGTDAVFPANLASVIAAAQVPVAFIAIWDQESQVGNLEWSQNPTDGAAWKQAFATISAASNAAGVGIPLSPNTIVLNISEDAYQGDAQFTVTVDGTQIGGIKTTSALHSTGDSGIFLLTGNWGEGLHTVQISFINDLYGGSATADRNLYVNSISNNGTTYARTTAVLYNKGSDNFTVGGTTPTASSPADTLTLNLSEDAYKGNAQFTLSIDGKQITTPQSVAALHSAAAWEAFSYTGNFGVGTHAIGVTFTNDAYGGSPSLDRNLYVNGIDVNGQHYGTGVTALYTNNNTVSFTVVTMH